MRFIHIPHSTSVCDNQDPMNPQLVFQAVDQAQAAEMAHALNECPFEVNGFFEEFIDLDINKVLGWRRVQVLNRPLGSDGKIERVLIDPLQLTKGTKQVLVKASKERPVRVGCMLQILCGRSKNC